MMIRVILPFHLRTLAHVGSELTLEVEGAVTQRSVLDALESRYPMLRGSHPRPRHATSVAPFCASSPARTTFPTSHPTPHSPTPSPSGKEPFIVIGAIAGG